MRKIYIDSEFRCHTTNPDGTFREVDNFFDGKCQTFIEGYRFIPAGETWTREDGVIFAGEMIAPIMDYAILIAAQWESDKAQGEITALAKAGAAQVQAYCADTGNPPKEDSGIFVNGVDAWEPGKTYEVNDLFAYDGKMGFVRQAHTAQEAWIPFTQGTESLYGARPSPDADGVYPYVYNMAASVGMQVKDPDDGLVYTCVQQISNMLYKPHEIQAHFEQA